MSQTPNRQSQICQGQLPNIDRRRSKIFLMNEQDEFERQSINGVSEVNSGVSDTKADEEELYRLKIIALQEYYDSVQLQTLRIRERIYNVRKQCRRLEGMKRAALNLLHYHTGTYEIPPLEIIDEASLSLILSNIINDPVPSFLESIQKQQPTTSEIPRKKPKRLSRSKLDGKLTPEEEERMKQKICSIIGSVYSESAKNVAETPKSCRISDRDASLSSDSASRKERNLFHIDYENVGEKSLKSVEGNTDLEEFGGGNNRSNASTIRASAHSEIANMRDKEQRSRAEIFQNDAGRNHSHYSSDENCNTSHSVVYKGEEKTSQRIIYHHAATSHYNGVLDYGSNVQQVQSVRFNANLTNNPFTTSLDSVQTMNYDDPSSTAESNIYFTNDSELVNCCSLHGVVENAAIYMNAVNCPNPLVPVKTPDYDYMKPLHLFDYAAILNAVQTMNDTTLARPELNYSAHPSTPLSYTVDNVVTTRAEIAGVNETVSSEAFGDVKSESIEQPKTETPASITNQQESVHVIAEKQETQNSTNNNKVCNIPLPDFIPYRMISVENSKPVEVTMVGSSIGEVPPSRPLPPRRRRKYKYVVESVLDNVPYTFRQAESDDD
ncbi:hypothetical protein KIN20_021103 [Parelaphostrongylus tenuis]|uniref:Uncharacterized protein n=1 Tax=Parelaphostrongylus tenuis TaxID=148309 RepID=A0AAD5QRC0_PARTN|nr:hypothetical protein KIN20_021103 [Parelaphostrongylus tenuis]